MGEDLYITLGISRGADGKEIKKAYRKKAMEFHPDKNPGDKKAEESFKKVSEAYEVLSDPQKKQSYDQFGTTGNKGGFQGFTNSDDIFSHFNDIFGDSFNFFNQRQQRPQTQRRSVRGKDLRVRIELTLEEAFGGLDKTITLDRNVKCMTCNGLGGSGRKTCSYCAGRGQINEIMRTPFGSVNNSRPCSVCNTNGYTLDNTCTDCKGRKSKVSRETISFHLFEGIEDGTMMTMKGKGDNIHAQIAGDLLIVVHLKPHERFHRQGLDLYIKEEFNIVDLILGGDKNIKTLDGVVSIKFNKGSKIGTTLKVKGKGMKYKERSGNLYIQIEAQIPQNITEEEKVLLEKLRNSENFT
tara:strand:+ start:8046 stop:9104 length:1059 start_codon:yes stop_codon:yes gene_type:complete